MTEKQIQCITDDFFGSLPNKAISNPKCLILFSGVPGSGKTSLAKVTEKEFCTVRLSNDDLRNLIEAYDPNIERSERERIKFEVRKVAFDMILGIANGLIVEDGSCDREDGFYYSWANKNRYRVILLRLEVSRQEIERRISARGDEGYKKVTRLTVMLDKWLHDWEEFGKSHEADIIITPDTSTEEFISEIRRIIKVLN